MEPEIDLEYQHAKWFKRKYLNPLPFVFFNIKNTFTEDYLGNNKNYYVTLNENEIKLKKFSRKLGFRTSIYIYISLIIALTIVLPYLTFDDFMQDDYYYVYLLLALPCLLLLITNSIQYFKSPDNINIIFDRKNGLLTMPKKNEWKQFTIPFQHLRAIIKFEVTGTQSLYFLNEIVPPKPWRELYLLMDMYIFGSNASKLYSWSFYVWYMDRNRPLPPGSAFDKFRQADFERRKAEGFPPPLFNSIEPTLEFTPQQQLVREAFWKDENYIASEKEAFYSIWKKNPYKK